MVPLRLACDSAPGAIVFGHARIVEDEAEKMRSLRVLGDKYNPHQDAALDQEVAKGYDRLHMIAIEIEHLTGKQSIELTRRSKQAGTQHPSS